MGRKVIAILMAAVLAFALVGCAQSAPPAPAEPSTPAEQSGDTGEQSPAPETTAPEESSTPDKKTLVVYFSWGGNTERMANYLGEQTGGELLELEPATPYPTDYTECTEVAKVERDNNERPKIANLPASLEGYDTILIGYPIWWHTAPMIIGSFLESYDLTGVELYPFTQSASMDTEQFENSMEFVRASAPGANVHDGLFVRASDTAGMAAYLTENQLVR